MTTQPVIALRKRREQIVREIRKLTKDLSHIDAAIKIMEPGFKPPSARHGAITRQMLEVLREADKPLTIFEIAVAMNAEESQVKDALKAQRRRGLVRGEKIAGKEMVWGLRNE